MAGKTKKQLVNEVLRKLREDELTSTESISGVPYANTIGDLMNDVKQEIEDAWNWGQLRSMLTFTTSSGISTYNLGDASPYNLGGLVRDSDGNLFDVTGAVTGIVSEDASNERTQILSVWDTTNDSELHLKSDNDFNRWTIIGSQQPSSPSYYRTLGFDSEGDKNIDLYPIPDGTYDISVWTYNPQDELTEDDSVLQLSCATKAIIYGTWAMAISERGEDGGQLYDEVTKKYQFFMSTAIARDRGDYADEADWVVV